MEGCPPTLPLPLVLVQFSFERGDTGQREKWSKILVQKKAREGRQRPAAWKTWCLELECGKLRAERWGAKGPGAETG